MMRTALGFGLITALAFAAPDDRLHAQDVAAAAAADPWSHEELENLLAPIALYPDPILAQVLVAATYPDQVLAAHAYVRAFGPDRIDDQPWEISVKAVARYAPVLNLMAEGEDWMVALGQAYATQQNDVMDAVQSLRRMANAQGNLQSTEQQVVVVEREVIRIHPAQPRIIYVPTYDPTVVYFRPVYVTHAHPAHWSWGIGYPIGVWLTYDFDWYDHHVYHHGWYGGPRWVVVSRPWVVVSPIYVGPHYHRTVVLGRRVVHRPYDAYRLRNYNVVHRNVTFERRVVPARRDVARNLNNGRGWTPDRGRSDDRATPSRGRSETRSTPQPRGRSDDRVRPIAGAPSPNRAATPTPARRGSDEWRTAAPARDASADRTPNPTRAAHAPSATARESNGTWNPRPGNAARTSPRISSEALGGVKTAPRPRESAPGAWSAPRGSAPKAAPAPRASNSTPRASSAPRASGSTPRASSAPRASSGGRAAAPRSSGGGGSRAASPRSSGGSKSGGSRSRGN